MIEYRHYNAIHDVLDAADRAGLLDDDGLGVYRRRADEIFEALCSAPLMRKNARVVSASDDNSGPLLSEVERQENLDKQGAVSPPTDSGSRPCLVAVPVTRPDGSDDLNVTADILEFPMEAAD